MCWRKFDWNNIWLIQHCLIQHVFCILHTNWNELWLKKRTRAEIVNCMLSIFVTFVPIWTCWHTWLVYEANLKAFAHLWKASIIFWEGNVTYKLLKFLHSSPKISPPHRHPAVFRFSAWVCNASILEGFYGPHMTRIRCWSNPNVGSCWDPGPRDPRGVPWDQNFGLKIFLISS